MKLLLYIYVKIECIACCIATKKTLVYHSNFPVDSEFAPTGHLPRFIENKHRI